VTQQPDGGEARDTGVVPEEVARQPSRGAAHRADRPADPLDDISGVENWVEEGGPLEPQDLDPGFGDAAAEMANGPLDTVAAQPAQEPTEVEEDPVERQLAERTADLQRLQAEYANYRKRVERDRVAVREQALANVLGELLPVLDDIGRAREHGELTGGFKSVAESLEAAVAKLGLTSYGEDGDPFDPNLHEALMHSYSADVTEPTCVRVLQPGYKIGDRTLRPARVAVAEPGGDSTDSPAGGPEPADTN